MRNPGTKERAFRAKSHDRRKLARRKDKIHMARHRCLNHPDVPAVTHCAQCHKPLCESCIESEAGEAMFCSAQCAAKNRGFYARYPSSSARRSGWISLLIKLVVLAAIAVALLYGGRVLGIYFCDELLKSLGL